MKVVNASLGINSEMSSKNNRSVEPGLRKLSHRWLIEIADYRPCSCMKRHHNNCRLLEDIINGPQYYLNWLYYRWRAVTCHTASQGLYDTRDYHSSACCGVLLLKIVFIYFVKFVICEIKCHHDKASKLASIWVI